METVAMILNAGYVANEDDTLGRREATLVDNEQATDIRATWDVSTLASGVYLYRIQAGSYSKTPKMSLVR